MNFGAGQHDRVRATLRWALIACAGFSLLWTGLTLFFPNLFVRIFMSPTEEVLAIAPQIIRCYCISFLLLPLNIFSTYYFQALMRPLISFLVSVSRGLVISGILILLLPTLFGGEALWFAMPLTELVVAVGVVFFMRRTVKDM